MALKAFFDANIYFAAARSKGGGSSLIIDFVKKKQVQLFATAVVLREAERNLRLKENINVLLTHYDNLKASKPKIVKIDKIRAKKKFSQIINEKDALVLAGAEKAGVAYLITLDRRHFFTRKVQSANLSFKIVTPGQLIRRLIT